MRRRVYHFDLTDVTEDPYQYDPDFQDRMLVLYDDGLWEKLIQAREALWEIEKAVQIALVDEPYDDVELALHFEAKELIDGGDAWDEIDYDTRISSIRARALAHARVQYKPPPKLTDDAQRQLDAMFEQLKSKYPHLRECPTCGGTSCPVAVTGRGGCNNTPA